MRRRVRAEEGSFGTVAVGHKSLLLAGGAQIEKCTASRLAGMTPAKDDTHKSERIWLKHEPYEGRSEVGCQKHLGASWGLGLLV